VRRHGKQGKVIHGGKSEEALTSPEERFWVTRLRKKKKRGKIHSNQLEEESNLGERIIP